MDSQPISCSSCSSSCTLRNGWTVLRSCASHRLPYCVGPYLIILPPRRPELKATHSEGGDVPLSDFFDLKSFAYYANVSMVQWRDVKIPDITGTQSESLSCWGWRDERPLERYNIKTSFWPFPGQLQVPSSIETSITFPGIEVLASQDNTPWLRETADRFYGGVDNAPAFPDQQLMCFENLFYVPTVKFVEGQLDTSYTIEELRPDGPVWNRVGAHLRFNDHVNHIVDEFLSALLGSRRRAYIGVHLRQGDFVTMGRASKASQEVADMYAAGAKQVQDALKKRRGGPKADLPVVFATDSDDPAFINKLARMGWIYVRLPRHSPRSPQCCSANRVRLTAGSHRICHFVPIWSLVPRNHGLRCPVEGRRVCRVRLSAVFRNPLCIQLTLRRARTARGCQRSAILPQDESSSGKADIPPSSAEAVARDLAIANVASHRVPAV